MVYRVFQLIPQILEQTYRPTCIYNHLRKRLDSVTYLRKVPQSNCSKCPPSFSSHNRQRLKKESKDFIIVVIGIDSRMEVSLVSSSQIVEVWDFR